MTATTQPHDASWVWHARNTAPVRMQRVRFRRTLDLHQCPASATITLSARTHYRLRVNDIIVASGPARSYPEFREADTHDLRSHLRKGANHIVVEVMHMANATFHHLAEPAGFIAWGTVSATGTPPHSLVTPGEWQCQTDDGLDPAAPPLSFAQGAIESASLLTEGAWHTPVACDRGVTRNLIPRDIPPLSRLPRPAMSVLQSIIHQDETVIGAWVAGTAVGKAAGSDQGQMAAARAWIHSPCEQTVRLAAWWGDYWVNGQLLAKGDDASRPLRQTMEVKLQAGWNRLHAAGSLIFGYWEFCLAWPAPSGLTIHSHNQRTAPVAVELTGPVPAVLFESCRPGFAADSPATPFAWREQSVLPAHCPPLRRLAWTIATPDPLPATFPLTLPAGVDTLLNVSMGGITLGSIAVDIEAPTGTVLDIGHAEQAGPGGRPDYAKTVVMYPADHFVLQGGRRHIETFQPRGLKHFELRVSGHNAPVVLHGTGVVERRYPYSMTGAFECSEPAFNRLWNYGQRTLELCSEDVLTDCPWRERTLYGGDLLAELGATSVLTHDLRLVRRSLELFLQSYNPATGWLQSMAPMLRERPPLSEYPLLIAIATAWYLRLSHDQAFARRAWPVFRDMAETTNRMRRVDGLYSPPWPAFIDHHRKCCAGPTAPFNATVVAGLRAFAETARLAGAGGKATGLEAQARALESLLGTAFFDPPSGLFRDLPLQEGGHTTEGTPATVWPLLFAPACRSLASQALPALRQMLETFSPDHEAQSVSPYQMFYLLSLLRELGEADLAESAIHRVYAGMLSTPTGTLWEHARPGQSLTHAWSCGVNDYLATTVLGVRLGFASARETESILVSPCAASLTWAKGCVPHPLGDVTVEWQRSGSDLSIHVNAPAGAHITIAPTGPLKALSLRTRETTYHTTG